MLVSYSSTECHDFAASLGSLLVRAGSWHNLSSIRPCERNTILKVHGNLQGLKPQHKNRLAKLYGRSLSEREIISTALAVSLCELSYETGRQIAVTIDRRARIRHVIVGDADGIFIPDLGRSRAGEGRFRGIRLIHTNFRNDPLTDEDLTDLIRLRFDMMAGIGVKENGRPGKMFHTHLRPFGS